MSDNSDVPLVWAISGNKDPGNGPKDHNRGPMQQHEGSMVNGMVENTSNTSNLVDNTANAQTRDNSAYEPSSVSTTEQFIDFRGSSAANESKSNRNRSDTRPVHKLFIGGVGYHTTDEDFRNYFLKFGPMTDCVVMREKGKFARPVHPHENLLADGESRGFGFVVFKHRDAMNACMDAKLELDGRPMDSKIAIPKGEGPEPRGRDREQRGREHADRRVKRRSRSRSPPPKRRSRDRSRERGRRSPGRDRGWGRDREPVQNLPPIAIRKETGSAFQESRRRKIFIGGLHIEATVTDIERYFGRFGRLIDSVVMFDHDTRRSRGFGFITYDNDESVQQVLNPSVIHKIMDRPVEVKLAVPKGEETLPPWKSNPAPTRDGRGRDGFDREEHGDHGRDGGRSDRRGGRRRSRDRDYTSSSVPDKRMQIGSQGPVDMQTADFQNQAMMTSGYPNMNMAMGMGMPAQAFMTPNGMVYDTTGMAQLGMNTGLGMANVAGLLPGAYAPTVTDLTTTTALQTPQISATGMQQVVPTAQALNPLAMPANLTLAQQQALLTQNISNIANVLAMSGISMGQLGNLLPQSSSNNSNNMATNMQGITGMSNMNTGQLGMSGLQAQNQNGTSQVSAAQSYVRGSNNKNTPNNETSPNTGSGTFSYSTNSNVNQYQQTLQNQNQTGRTGQTPQNNPRQQQQSLGSSQIQGQGQGQGQLANNQQQYQQQQQQNQATQLQSLPKSVTGIDPRTGAAGLHAVSSLFSSGQQSNNNNAQTQPQALNVRMQSLQQQQQQQQPTLQTPGFGYAGQNSMQLGNLQGQGMNNYGFNTAQLLAQQQQQNAQQSNNQNQLTAQQGQQGQFQQHQQPQQQQQYSGQQQQNQQTSNTGSQFGQGLMYWK